MVISREKGAFMPNVDIDVTPNVDKKLQSLGFVVGDWSSAKRGFCPEVEEVLSTASKQLTGNIGYPDRIYFNKDEKLLILVEEKPTMKDHYLPDISRGCISGIKWYLSRFLNEELQKKHKKLVNKFDNYKIIGIAVSGNILEDYQHKFDCFLLDLKEQKIKEVSSITNFVSECEFLQLFDNTDIDELIKKISQTTKDVNNLLRNIESQRRPILLSALMICLHKKKGITNNFNEYYDTLAPKRLVDNILSVSKDILKQEGIPEEKIKIFEKELGFLETDPLLSSNDILKQILNTLESDVIPLFNNQIFVKSNYDIIGKFYEEFLKYAGITNVKKGIVLTPRHITTLFTKLIDLKYNDKIVDLCCGTGAFLIAGMNAIIDKINKSEISGKTDLIDKVKSEQLLGFEISTTMYICAISNMMFRGDGKSSIHCCDSINSDEANKILEDFRPTIGFINPPYGGKENSKNNTPKEISFLCKLLKHCSRYGIMIAPLSVYNKDVEIRNEILKEHTLKAVINMPGELFLPNAGVHTAISVFETNRPFDYENDEVLFYDLQDDGFILNKNQGRVDYYKKWDTIEKNLLDTLKNGVPDNIKFVKTKIKKGCEWTIYAFSETDYASLCENNFVKTISEYAIFKAKREMNLLNLQDEADRPNEFELLAMLSNYYGVDKFKVEQSNKNKIDITNWRFFKIFDKEHPINSLFQVPSIKGDLKEKDCLDGNIALVSASKYNSGIVKYIDDSGDGKAEIFNENSITADMFCNVFYQDEKFYSVSHGRVNVLLPNFLMNKYTALFIITLLRCEQYKYPYGRNLYMDEIKNTSIKLPAKESKDKEGNIIYEPDWQYMEDYIKSLPYADLL